MQLPAISTIVSFEEIQGICKYFGLDSLWEKIRKDPPPKPFSSDGASCFPDNIGSVDVYPAAFLHDLKYWSGHPGEDTARFIADCELAIDIVRLCGGSPELAMLMLDGVRVGGSDKLSTPWKWGFGRDG